MLDFFGLLPTVLAKFWLLIDFLIPFIIAGASTRLTIKTEKWNMNGIEMFPANQNEKKLTTRGEEPLLFQLKESAEERPNTTHANKPTIGADRENKHDD